MLQREILSSEHKIIDECAAQLLADLENGEASIDDIAARRWRLTRVLLAHLAKEDKLLYPQLRSANDQRLAGIATRFSDEMGGLAAEYSRYMADWTIDRMRQDWTSFQTDTRRVLTALRRRIARENRELYPLLRD